MDKEWLPLVRQSAPVKNSGAYSNLLRLMTQIDSERGLRLTNEQADAVQKLIAVLIDEIRAHKT